MSSSVVLHATVATLHRSGIPFMLTGSFAAAAHGVPRATMDIDIVIDPTAVQLRRYTTMVLDAGQYVSPDAAEEALQHESLFNVIDPESGWKIDLIIRKSRAFSRTEFDRRQELDFDGIRLPVATIEDVVLSKLESARLGGSARQLDDVAALLRLRAGRYDAEYVQRWVRELGLAAEWATAIRLATQQGDSVPP